MHAIHNSWRNFEEPDKFLPERWLAPGADYARPLKGGELACTSGEQKLSGGSMSLSDFHCKQEECQASLLFC